MAAERQRWTWPPTRRDIVAVGNLLLFAAGLVIIGFGLANGDLQFTILGAVVLAVPTFRWLRVQLPSGPTFEGELEKPPDDVSERKSEDEPSRRHSG